MRYGAAQRDRESQGRAPNGSAGDTPEQGPRELPQQQAIR